MGKCRSGQYGATPRYLQSRFAGFLHQIREGSQSSLINSIKEYQQGACHATHLQYEFHVIVVILAKSGICICPFKPDNMLHQLQILLNDTEETGYRKRSDPVDRNGLGKCRNFAWENIGISLCGGG
ncbi:hypothetical protein An11g06620 [Aspergillus niger]|uniref:Uncharacterized protein n=2 Tax=Aspergillus niger TaxID=5061 RepID=A2QWV7_ASPNC|nr:hypothetical protein An11g06620 [Aspergillus niger]CAK96959.1 hypothetical protein An11g06620 [Aspergillus niger]